MLISARPSASWDWVGQALSALCIVHCVALPLMWGLLPSAAAEMLEGEWLHQALIGFVGITALAAFVPGFFLHRRVSVPGLAVLALVLLFGAAFLLPEEHEGFEAFETGLTLGGGALMTCAHWRNRMLCRECCAPPAPPTS
ncbi:MerC domain-containing protein [Hyalangium rubrum]|uniref:MerC domain-containing protein n=1 Tax=Hyalangium rubrum TaxID=3103134 RepID=A0ABU5GUI2_9BACT|nr:MerC domain-containing protein [Hyalangium sp. s54d21]MDY7224843.1 MerC domain-containing protein [Hyalangium sp. s54d21]